MTLRERGKRRDEPAASSNAGGNRELEYRPVRSPKTNREARMPRCCALVLQASLEDKPELILQAVSSSGVNFRSAELVRAVLQP
jgi:hypothetical protein